VVSTIFKGPPPIVQLQNEIIAAKNAYIDALTLVSGTIPGLPYTKDDTTPGAEGDVAEGKAMDQETLTRGSTFTLVENEMQSTGSHSLHSWSDFKGHVAHTTSKLSRSGSRNRLRLSNGNVDTICLNSSHPPNQSHHLGFGITPPLAPGSRLLTRSLLSVYRRRRVSENLCCPRI
jgi:hypothetical protein